MLPCPISAGAIIGIITTFIINIISIRGAGCCYAKTQWHDRLSVRRRFRNVVWNRNRSVSWLLVRSTSWLLVRGALPWGINWSRCWSFVGGIELSNLPRIKSPIIYSHLINISLKIAVSCRHCSNDKPLIGALIKASCNCLASSKFPINIQRLLAIFIGKSNMVPCVEAKPGRGKVICPCSCMNACPDLLVVFLEPERIDVISLGNNALVGGISAGYLYPRRDRQFRG